MSRQAWGAAAVAAGKRASDIQRAQKERKLRREYNEYRAEARYCGYEVESFAEWKGETSSRAAAEARICTDFHYMDLY